MIIEISPQTGDQPDEHDFDGKLTPAVFVYLYNLGYSGAEIARMYGVTSAWASLVRKQAEAQGIFVPNAYDRARAAFPWKIPGKFQPTSPYQRLRDHAAKYFGGKLAGPEREQLLAGFYRRARDEKFVVDFHPNNPPAHGKVWAGGWVYLPRGAGDEDFLIRFPADYDGDREVWRNPLG